jgi:hypothetical protein
MQLPIIVDVTAPTFTGSHIDVRLEEEPLTLVVNWSRDSFQDEEHDKTNQYLIIFNLTIDSCTFCTFKMS